MALNDSNWFRSLWGQSPDPENSLVHVDGAPRNTSGLARYVTSPVVQAGAITTLFLAATYTFGAIPDQQKTNLIIRTALNGIGAILASSYIVKGATEMDYRIAIDKDGLIVMSEEDRKASAMAYSTNGYRSIRTALLIGAIAGAANLQDSPILPSSYSFAGNVNGLFHVAAVGIRELFAGVGASFLGTATLCFYAKIKISNKKWGITHSPAQTALARRISFGSFRPRKFSPGMSATRSQL